MGWVPVVDVSDADRAVVEVERACRDVGFLTVVGHGVPTEVLRRLWSTAQDFFDLPLDERMSVAMPTPGYPYGYSPIAGETLSASLGYGAAPDLKESFAIGPPWPPRHEFADADEAFAWSPNLWPPAVPAMRPVWERAFGEMAALAGRLLALMARALDLPADWFEPLIDRHTSAMRALNYPGAGDVTATEGQFGASAHTDYGTLTVLLADSTQPGLQVLDQWGVWHDVVPPHGALVVNLGDAMSRWTNDHWRSTMHRVVVPERRRQSVAFFHNANWDAVIECLPGCREPGVPPRYEPMAAGPHLMHKFRSTVN
jgi:isopenicillin N synthase-like dioxygenase